jgi:DNA repair protein RadC
MGDHELVALLLGAGTRDRPALTIAHALLAASGGAEGLLASGLDELRRVPGVGLANAARVVAAVELGRRIVVRPAGDRPRFDKPGDMARHLLLLYGGFRVERFGVALLDRKRRLIRSTIVSVGELDATAATPREILREALLAPATSVVLFHNHPSGDPAPSPEDLALTIRLAKAGEVVGVRVTDHIILGHGRYYSFQEGGHL